MLKLKKIAVTGGIASGKTTVCQLFEKLGAYVVSADTLVHQLLSPHSDLGKEIIQMLGQDIIREGKIDREKIAQKVFSNPELLKKLEQRVHPEVQKVIEAQYQEISSEDYPFFVAEIPLLFESGTEKDYDWIIVVTADEETSKKRFRKKNPMYDEGEFEKRNKRLTSIQKKIKHADFVIENNGSLETLQRSVQTIFNSLKGKI